MSSGKLTALAALIALGVTINGALLTYMVQVERRLTRIETKLDIVTVTEVVSVTVKPAI